MSSRDGRIRDRSAELLPTSLPAHEPLVFFDWAGPTQRHDLRAAFSLIAMQSIESGASPTFAPCTRRFVPSERTAPEHSHALVSPAAIPDGPADFDRNLISPDRYPIIREVLSLDLTPSQRSSVRSIVDAARTEARAQARSSAIEQARHVLLDDKTRTDGRTSPLNLYLESAGKLRTRTSNEVLALLTAPQREAYEASSVVDPSAASTVSDD